MKWVLWGLEVLDFTFYELFDHLAEYTILADEGEEE